MHGLHYSWQQGEVMRMVEPISHTCPLVDAAIEKVGRPEITFQCFLPVPLAGPAAMHKSAGSSSPASDILKTDNPIN
jgi:hypothetical protein